MPTPAAGAGDQEATCRAETVVIGFIPLITRIRWQLERKTGKCWLWRPVRESKLCPQTNSNEGKVPVTLLNYLWLQGRQETGYRRPYCKGGFYQRLPRNIQPVGRQDLQRVYQKKIPNKTFSEPAGTIWLYCIHYFRNTSVRLNVPLCPIGETPKVNKNHDAKQRWDNVKFLFNILSHLWCQGFSYSYFARARGFDGYLHNSAVS